MTFRFTLTDPIGGTKIISEPGGWDTAAIGLERHPKLLSLVEFFKSSFQTYGSNGSEDGGRDWILNVEKVYGPDALIRVLVEIDPNDEGIFRTLYSGNLGVGLFVETLDLDHLLQIVFANSDFWSKIMSRWESEVDLRSTEDLDGNAVEPTPKFTLPLPGQIIERKYLGQRNRNAVIPFVTNPYLVFGFDTETSKEIQEESSLFASEAPDLESVVPQFNLAEDGKLNVNDIKITVSFSDILTDANRPIPLLVPQNFNCATNDKTGDISPFLDLYLQKNNEDPIIFSKATRAVPASFVRNDGLLVNNQGTTVTDYTLSGIELVCKKHDAIRIYGKLSLTLYRDVYVWGVNGWDHDSGADQTRNGQGTYCTVEPGGHTFAENKGVYEYGGYFDSSSNIFPALINGHAILANNWWNSANAGNLGGTIVSDKNILTAKVNNPANVGADWDIGTLTLYEGLEAYGTGSVMDLTFQSSAIDSTTEAFHTHDIAAGILDRISGRSGLFYSPYLGHPWTSRIYPSTGCGSLKANMKGIHVRGYVLEGDPDPAKNRPLAPSMRDWWEGINPIECLGLGYNKKDGDDIIECGPAAQFFDDSSMSILFSNVQTIKRSYDPNWQFNSVDYGYEKWQSQAATGIGAPSGIDDPQSQGTRNTVFKIIGKKIKIWSKWLGAGLAIETMRRLGIAFTSNYTYDDQIVVIALHSNGDGTFTPELSEDFSSVVNLTNAATRYNKSITSTRNFIRWLPYLSGCLQSYLSSTFKFITGQGNFTMSSTKTTDCPGDEMGDSVAENSDIPISDDFLFLPMPFEIDHYMDFDDYETLVANKNLAIGISQTDANHKPFFIDKLNYVLATGLVKIVAWPKEAFDIIVPDTFSSVGSNAFKYFEVPYHETQFE